MSTKSNMLTGDSHEGLLFSSLFIGAILALTSVLYAVDVATVRALLFP